MALNMQIGFETMEMNNFELYHRVTAVRPPPQKTKVKFHLSLHWSSKVTAVRPPPENKSEVQLSLHWSSEVTAVGPPPKQKWSST